MARAPNGQAVVGAALAALVVIFASVPAAAQTGPEVRGARLFGALKRGDQRCDQFKSGDFEAIGEFVMARMAGSARAHASMNRLMETMMGPRGEEQMHEVMGRRLTGCGGGTSPAGFGRMMGALGLIMGGTMGAGSGGAGVPGYGMMGGSASGGARFGNDDDEGPSAVAMVGMMAVLIGAVALVLVWLRPKRRSSGPQEVLEQRFARGELSAEEYRQSKQLLEGGRP